MGHHTTSPNTQMKVVFNSTPYGHAARGICQAVLICVYAGGDDGAVRGCAITCCAASNITVYYNTENLVKIQATR